MTIIISLLAVVLFSTLFLVNGIGGFDFWWWMAANLVLLITLVACFFSEWRKALRSDLTTAVGRKIALGLLSALALYLVFAIGNILLRRLLPVSGSDIGEIYQYRSTAGTLRIGLLMLFIIGPGEELFWRGFIQDRLQIRLGRPAGFLAGVFFYTVIHLGTGNPVLMLAAAVCGLFWGYFYYRTGSLLLNCVSHTAWDLAVFLIFPLL
ncbi:MAG: type II CAAX endopeptidase family protein [Candidatus Neomarinimicrobiota bacterium]